MVLTIFEGGTTQSTSQSLSVPVYIKKESTNPGRKIECTCARMMGKTPDVQFGMLFQHRMCDLYWESGFIYL